MNNQINNQMMLNQQNNQQLQQQNNQVVQQHNQQKMQSNSLGGTAAISDPDSGTPSSCRHYNAFNQNMTNTNLLKK